MAANEASARDELERIKAWRATNDENAALRAECARLREEVARLTTNLEYLSKYHSGCGAHSMTIVKRAERAEASLAEALDVARLVVSGGDKDGFWSSDWGHVYGRARSLLSRLRPSTPSAGGGG